MTTDPVFPTFTAARAINQAVDELLCDELVAVAALSVAVGVRIARLTESMTQEINGIGLDRNERVEAMLTILFNQLRSTIATFHKSPEGLALF
jgi:hypothetical protein